MIYNEQIIFKGNIIEKVNINHKAPRIYNTTTTYDLCNYMHTYIIYIYIHKYMVQGEKPPEHYPSGEKPPF